MTTFWAPIYLRSMITDENGVSTFKGKTKLVYNEYCNLYRTYQNGRTQFPVGQGRRKGSRTVSVQLTEPLKTEGNKYR